MQINKQKDMRFIKIYGEQNSGTIYLEWLLNKNLDTTLLDSYEFGWKHRMAPSEDELTDKIKQEVLFLCLVKNPYSWLISMHKRPYHHESLRKLSFFDFLKYSYGDYRNQWRINHAKQLITEGKAHLQTIEAIGLQSGFVTRNTFLNAFKRLEGITPTDFASQTKEMLK